MTLRLRLSSLDRVESETQTETESETETEIDYNSQSHLFRNNIFCHDMPPPKPGPRAKGKAIEYIHNHTLMFRFINIKK